MNDQEKTKSLFSFRDKNYLIAQARSDVVIKYLAECYKKPRTSKKKKLAFINKFNSGHWRELHLSLGNITYATLERWKKTYLDNNRDYKSLAPGYGKLNKSYEPLNEYIIQVHLETDKTSYEDLKKLAITMIRIGKVKVYNLQ
jgi:hypothetical protein